MTDLVAPRIDGRTARAERTRNAIVEAHLELIGEGDLKPTGERIAERAGVSLRALWANFKDMEALFAPPASGSASARTRSTSRSRSTCRCRGGSTSSAGNARASWNSSPRRRGPPSCSEPFSAQLRSNRAQNIARVQRELKDLFAAELDAAGAGAGAAVHSLTVASTWAAWSMMRDELDLGVEEAPGSWCAR